MDARTRYFNAYRDLSTLANELVRRHGYQLEDTVENIKPTYLQILEDMLEKGINDPRIQPILEEYKEAIALLKDHVLKDKIVYQGYVNVQNYK